MICDVISKYISIVRSGEYPVCGEQIQLCDYVEKIFKNEDIYVNEEQLEKYFALQKYFPYELFPWEKFVFALHNCTYTKAGQLRWPVLFMFVGRGTGKNGYLAFEDFALTTPVNGVKYYNIDIFANDEDQAKLTFEDIYNILEENPGKFKKYFYWTKEVIQNKKTKSRIKFNTSNSKTKDGRRPGKVDFDEYHQYENYRLIDIAKTGLGKKAYPRQTIISTNGNVRNGPLDDLIDRSEKILQGILPDNGLLPFICRLKDKKEIHDPKMWHKANPSLRYFPNLMAELLLEYEDYKMDNLGNISFEVRRMNLMAGNTEQEVTSWENILKTNRVMPDLEGYSCIAGIDYARTTDFVAAGLLFETEQKWYWITHSWVCRRNPALSRIRFPLDAASEKGLLTFVDEVEIPPDLPAGWIRDQAELYDIAGLALDEYRYALMKRALKDVGFDAEKDGYNNIKRVRPSDIMKAAPTISSQFNNHRVIWGDNPLMRWYINNAKQILDTKGNVTYGKIEPKSRKTDGFMAFVAAATMISDIDGWNDRDITELPDVLVF